MTNLKKVFLVMLVIILLGATVVLATDNTDTIFIQDTDTNTVNTANGVNTLNRVNSINTLNTAGNTSNYTNTNLPQTGANDYAMVLIIGIFAVSAVYAYKKINEYKNI
ncbi:MAG: LPXTG cell wall anchor domain-containing protein [Clostridia bacterium]|nr:LPXTG cell wall anchor domain-containing protein [Clostridia bacterium]